MIPVGVAAVPVSPVPGQRRPLDVNSINLQHIKNRLTLLSVCLYVGGCAYVSVCVCALVFHCGILLEPECCAFMCAPVVRCLPSCERADWETDRGGGGGKETEPEMCVSNCKHVRTAAQCGINFR